MLSIVNGTSTRIELAWAAGFFDGEGCFSGNRAMVVNTDLSLLERFQKIVGFGTIRSRKKGAPHHKDSWIWVACSFEHYQALVCFFWEWLSDRRKERALEVLLVHKNKKCRPGGIMCRRGLHRLEAGNVYINPRHNRSTGRPFRTCLICKREGERRRVIA